MGRGNGLVSAEGVSQRVTLGSVWTWATIPVPLSLPKSLFKQSEFNTPVTCFAERTSTLNLLASTALLHSLSSDP